MRLDAKKTPISVTDLLNALLSSWTDKFGSAPTRNTLLVAVSQSALETGRWCSLWNFNLGNAKSDGVTGDWTFYTCGEDLPSHVAQHLAAEDARIKIKWDNGTIASIIVSPDHPICRFRAFGSLDDGCKDYLNLIFARFGGAWPALLAGDPRGFVVALKAAGYFTANVDIYAASVVALFNEFSKIDWDLPTPALQSPPEVLPACSDTLSNGS